MLSERENAKLVLSHVSAETPLGRASRRAAEDVLRLLDEKSEGVPREEPTSSTSRVGPWEWNMGGAIPREEPPK